MEKRLQIKNGNINIKEKQQKKMLKQKCLLFFLYIKNCNKNYKTNYSQNEFSFNFRKIVSRCGPRHFYHQ